MKKVRYLINDMYFNFSYTQYSRILKAHDNMNKLKFMFSKKDTKNDKNLHRLFEAFC